MNVIDPIQIKWASLVVFAPKKDGTLRFFVDYRKRNAVTIRVSYHIARVKKYKDSLIKSEVFWTLDEAYSYSQIEVDTSDHKKIAFTSHRSL